jgi:hypothetical protein
MRTREARSFVPRLAGAAWLNRATYEEVEADAGATSQALAVVALSSLAGGLGSRGFGGSDPVNIAFFSAVSLVGWGAWAVLTYQIGVRILPGSRTSADVGELLRTLGFASAPGMLRVFGLLPGLTVPVFALTAVWMLLTMIVAVRQALDYTSTRRAVAVCLLGWTLTVVFGAVIGFFFGPRVS